MFPSQIQCLNSLTTNNWDTFQDKCSICIQLINVFGAKTKTKLNKEQSKANTEASHIKMEGEEGELRGEIQERLQ